MEQNYLFAPPARVAVPIVGRAERFPVHRVYCLVRNHRRHAQEMGASAEVPPTVFLKPADTEALVVLEGGEEGVIRYPSLTGRLHHEVELVVAIGVGGAGIRREEALGHVLGYASGLDMTRQDLLNEASRQGFPWCIGKSFTHCAVIGPITLVEGAGALHDAEFGLQVNGEERQRGRISELIWGVAEAIEKISRAWELQPGDLIYMGTCDGVAAVLPGDVMEGGVSGLGALRVHVAAHSSFHVDPNNQIGRES
jgi:fumarylpyruvate hydrolase